MTEKRKIIALVGMSGAGKSQAGEFFKNKGLQVLRFGSAVDDGLKADGLPWTPENTARYREKIREELGMAAVAVKMLPKIQKVLKADHAVVLDGLYSWEEYTFLKEKLPELVILCVYAKPEIRYARLSVRKERPFSPDEARKRDIHEIEIIHKAGPIAFADYLIKNETTIDAFTEELEMFYAALSHD
jgi:dephospho-CoA kinase